ncbi:MAG: class II glutamine amidotransferase, partial [Bacillota bacterium]|nr:class II glutamine amidotransferase [Bacillota bacterium]
MCGLYGFSHYGDNKIKDLAELTNSLADKSAIRGTDATGIAFCSNGNVNILKETKSAYRLNFKHSDNICALIGHTRHSTQGSEKKNFNNHPFYGRCFNARFALAHNGVLT